MKSELLRFRPGRTTLPRAALALGLGVTLCGCAVDGASSTRQLSEATDRVSAVDVGTAASSLSALGTFLAAMRARADGNYTAAADYYEGALASDPDNSALVSAALAVALADGRFPRAVALAGALIQAEPASDLARQARAVDHIIRGAHAAALSEIALSEHQADSGAALTRAWANAGLGRTEDARAALGALLSTPALTGVGGFHLALVLDLAGDRPAADAAYKDIVAATKTSAIRVVEAYGSFLRRGGAYDAAKALYEEYLARDPGNPLIAEELARVAAAPPPFIESAAAGLAEGLFDLAGELAQQGRVEGATINVRLALALHRDFPAAQALLGSLLEAAQRWDAAIVLYRSIAPGTPYAWNGRLRTAAVLERIERIEEARGVLEAMAAERPERTDALVALADMLRAREHWAEAITAYDRVFERIRAPEQPSWTLHYTRGIALERAGTWERAEAEFLKALELERDQPLVLNYLGYSWIEQGRNYDRALQMLQRAVSLRPRDGYVTDSLGWVYYRMGDHVEAVRWLERAVELVPDDPVINDHLGDAYWRVGRVNEARFQWNRALSFAPAAKEVPLIEAKLRGGLADDQANSQPPAAQ